MVQGLRSTGGLELKSMRGLGLRSRSGLGPRSREDPVLSGRRYKG